MTSSGPVNGFDPWKEMLSGTVIKDRYVIREMLGKGAMGFVYKVYDRTLKSDLALKILRPDKKSHAIPEVRHAHRVVDRRVCQVYDIRNVHDTTVIVMEYINGSTLAEIIKRRNYSPLVGELGTNLAHQLSHGLVAIHNAGLIHRDLKPQNILIATPEGGSPTAPHVVKIADLGISVVAEEVYKAEAFSTPAYEPPEYQTDPTPTVHGDIYSLGLVLFEIFAGYGPFRAVTLPKLREEHRLKRPEPLVTLVPEIPKEISEIVARCLEKDPALRPQDAMEVARVLDQFVDVSDLDLRTGHILTIDLGRYSTQSVKAQSIVGAKGVEDLDEQIQDIIDRAIESCVQSSPPRILTGDGAILFLASTVHALEIAQSIHSTSAKINSKFPQRDPKHFRVGIAHGEVVISEGRRIGSREVHSMNSHAITVAARLQEAGRTGEILIDQHTYGLAPASPQREYTEFKSIKVGKAHDQEQRILAFHKAAVDPAPWDWNEGFLFIKITDPKDGGAPEHEVHTLYNLVRSDLHQGENVQPQSYGITVEFYSYITAFQYAVKLRGRLASGDSLGLSSGLHLAMVVTKPNSQSSSHANAYRIALENARILGEGAIISPDQGPSDTLLVGEVFHKVRSACDLEERFEWEEVFEEIAKRRVTVGKLVERGKAKTAWIPSKYRTVSKSWQLELMLGRGASGETWLAKRKEKNTGNVDPEEETVFKFARTKDAIPSLEREKEIYELIQTQPVNKHSDKILRYYDDSEIGMEMQYLRFEYLCHGSLADWLSKDPESLERLDFKQRLSIVRQVAEALGLLHDLSRSHGDLGFSNIFIRSFKAGVPQIVLGDFGGDPKRLSPTGPSSETINSTETSSSTTAYFADSLEDDLFRFCLLACALLTGSPQMPAAETQQQLDVLQSQLEEKVDSPSLRNELLQNLTVKPDQRSVQAEVIDLLYSFPERDRDFRDEADQRRRQELRKTIARRTRFAVLASAVAIFGLIALFQTKSALHHRKGLGEILDSYTRVFSLASPEQTFGPPPPIISGYMSRILDVNVEEAHNLFSEYPLSRARAIDSIGQIYTSLGRFEDAGPLLLEAERLRDVHRAPARDRARSQHSLGILMARTSRLTEAETFLRNAITFREEAGDAPRDLAESLQALGLLLAEQGTVDGLEQAQQHLGRALKTLGGNADCLIVATADQSRNLSLASAFNDYAVILDRAENHRKAGACFHSAHEIVEDTLEGHPYRAWANNNYALHLIQHGRDREADLSKARELLTENLEILERTYRGTYVEADADEKARHQSIAITHASMAEWHRSQSQFEDALESYDAACNMQAELVYQEQGSRDLLAKFYLARGTLHQQLDRFEEAEQDFSLALAALQPDATSIGYDGPVTDTAAEVLTNLGQLLAENGNFTQGFALLDRAQQLYSQVFGPGSLAVARAKTVTAGVYAYIGGWQEAERLYREALPILREGLGAGHPRVADSENGMATVLSSQGKESQAADYYKRALSTLLRTVGAASPHTATAKANLAQSLRDSGQPGEAVDLLTEALGVYTEVLGPDHTEVAWVLDHRGIAYELDGNWNEAAADYSRALEIRRDVYGPEDHRTMTVYLNQARLAYAQGDSDSCLSIIEPAIDNLRPQKSNLPAEHWKPIYAKVIRGGCRLAEGELDAAEQDIVDSQAWLEENRGVGSRYNRDALERLIALSEARGDMAKQQDYQNQLDRAEVIAFRGAN